MLQGWGSVAAMGGVEGSVVYICSITVHIHFDLNVRYEKIDKKTWRKKQNKELTQVCWRSGAGGQEGGGRFSGRWVPSLTHRVGGWRARLHLHLSRFTPQDWKREQNINWSAEAGTSWIILKLKILTSLFRLMNKNVAYCFHFGERERKKKQEATHLAQRLQTSQAWSGTQKVPGLHLHLVSAVVVQWAVSISSAEWEKKK